MCRLAVVIPLILALVIPPSLAQEALLPDLFFDEPTLAGHELDDTTHPGELLYRFDTSIPNIGAGEFQLEATGTPIDGVRFEVVQRIFRDDMTSFTRDAGDFIYDPTSTSMVSEGWVRYRLRALLPGNEVGPILWEGGKASVHISSSTIYDATLPGVPSGLDRIVASGGVQGISVGYTDLYPRFFPHQWLNVTGFASGDYWLEVEVDPANNVLEEDETNNVTRRMITLELPDSDGDGLSDTFEEAIGTSPSNTDSDADGLSDFEEVGFDGDAMSYMPFTSATPDGTDTNALLADTDGDGLSDRTEVMLNSDPLDAADGISGSFSQFPPFTLFLLILFFFFFLSGL